MTDGRDARGRFAKGNPGGGRPKGAKSRTTLAAEKLQEQLERHGHEVLMQAVRMAREGDATMVKALLDRLLPVATARETAAERRLNEMLNEMREIAHERQLHAVG